ncbi:unnamed protein product [Clonostachys solani]|uniref:F-box domain-containing protein n=1 Tax=Clonostachys solani TaxID=160281 RepID=A0A9N9W9C6_9HYPO|nr:unnamed protein product [Clonostachys solani]
MKESRMASVVLHERILQASAVRQTRSALLTKIPPEIRTEIFTLVLQSYPDQSPERKYDGSEAFARPGYSAPLETCTAVLRTCRAVYQEYWQFPFFLREQIHWAVNSGLRCPPTYSLATALKKLQSSFPMLWLRQEFRDLRVFTQVYALEKEGIMNRILSVGVRPHIITITIRHTDWCNWENGPLKLEGNWTRGVSKVLPTSVRQLIIELESVRRMKEQVDELASQMMEKWLFQRDDGVTLSPQSVAYSTWRGKSMRNGDRWNRYGTANSRIQYYIARVYFRWEERDPRRYTRKRNQQLRLYNPEWRPLPAVHEPMNLLPEVEETLPPQIPHLGLPRFMRDTISSSLKKRRP